MESTAGPRQLSPLMKKESGVPDLKKSNSTDALLGTYKMGVVYIALTGSKFDWWKLHRIHNFV